MVRVGEIRGQAWEFEESRLRGAESECDLSMWGFRVQEKGEAILKEWQ